MLAITTAQPTVTRRRITQADRDRAVTVHLPRGCRARKRATSTDPAATTCRTCLRSRHWRAVIRRAIRTIKST